MTNTFHSVLRPTRAEIDLSALEHNLRVVRDLAGDAEIMAVVKAEGYGHGLTAVAREFERLGADWLGVSFLEEGVALRQAGLKLPILVMGGVVDEQIELYLEHRLAVTVSSIWKARQVDAAARTLGRRAEVHLKVDTGMGRIGQHWETADLLFREAVALPGLHIIGLYTHFASAEDEDGAFTHIQLERFHQVIAAARSVGLNPFLIHAANSGALMQHLPQARFTMVRPGLILYGWAPAYHLEGRFNLKPAMRLRTQAVFVKRPAAGATVGYGSTWTSPGGRWLATLPIGYGDGFPRRAGNKAKTLFRGRLCPIVGRVSMDQIVIDAGDDAYLGDEAVLFGTMGERFLSIWDLCRSVDAVPYEILCGLTSRVPRVYFNSRNSSPSE